MAVSAKLFATFPENLGGGDASGDGPMDLLSDTIKLSLHLAAASVSQTLDEVFANVPNELTTTGGYTAGGATLASKTYDTSSLVTTFDAADVTWSSTTFTHRYGVLWDDTIATPTDPLIGYVDNGGDVTTASTDLVYVWNASGIFTITVA
jgi:hypothetical protein